MGSLEKFPGAIELLQAKMDGLRKVMSLVMREAKDAEDHSKMIRDLLSGGFGELESKEKHLKTILASVKQRCENFDLKKLWVEKGLKKLDEKHKLLKGVLQELQVEKMDFGKMKDYVDEQLKHVVLKEKEFQSLFEELKLIQGRVEGREKELVLTEKSLKRRGDVIDSKKKELDKREHEVDAKERLLDAKKNEIDFEDERLKRRLNDLDTKETILVGRENEIASKEKILARREEVVHSKEKNLVARESEIDAKQKMLDTRYLEVESKEWLLEKRENVIRSEEERINKREIELLRKSLKEPDSGRPVRGNGIKRCKKTVLSSGICDANEGINMDENRSKHAKRSCFGDRFSGQTKANELEILGSNAKSQVQTSQDLVILDDSEFGSDKMANLASKSTGDPSSFSSGIEKGKLAKHFNLGETWACFNGKDNFPRSYAQIINVIDNGGKVRIEVAWLEAFPGYEGEKEWVGAGLPVTCGMFKPSRTSVEAPSIFSHLTVCDNSVYPLMIFPLEGETWAIYKDWNIHTWASHPEIHRQCQYEIVEILNYSPTGSSSFGVRVAYLDKITGSVNSFQRRSKNEEKSFLIQVKCLYVFSHKVPSIKKSCADANGNLDCIFELDLKSLPLGLH